MQQCARFARGKRSNLQYLGKEWGDSASESNGKIFHVGDDFSGPDA
jgi:hypothetical protein